MAEVPKDKNVTFLKGGLIVNHDCCFEADILIEGETIRYQFHPQRKDLTRALSRNIGLRLSVPNNARIIDVTDKFIVPGGVDLDCHLGEASLNDPLADSFETGSKAAVLGGTTTIINTVEVPKNRTLSESFAHFVESAGDRVFCDYAACMRVPCLTDDTESDMEHLVKEKGMCFFSLKLGVAERSGGIACDSLNEEEFNKVLRKCRALGALPIVPAITSSQLSNQISSELLRECPELGPELVQLSQPQRAEADTIRKVVLHAFETESVCPLLISRIHSDLALQCFSEQRRYCRGLIFGQTTISAIAAPIAALNRLGEQPGEMDLVTSKDWATAAGYVSEPPIRPNSYLSEKLIAHLNSDDMLSVGSGHRAVSLDVKASYGLKRSAKIPKSIAALGCRLVALWDCAVDSNGGLDHCSFVRAVSTGPARLANLYPQKGRIAVGSDADIVVWSKPDTLRNVCWTQLLPKDVYNVFSGLSPRSRPEVVLLRGHIVVLNGKLVDEEAHGRLLFVKPFGQMAFSRVDAVDQNRETVMEKISREPYTGHIVGCDSKGAHEETKEHHYFRKEYYDNVPKVALPPGQRQIHTSVKTAQPPGGSSNSFWFSN
ncbi:Dihydropyrimidinase [Fasciola hepatica]|uniref:dihydropyrimidinase n=1 Tax=Fasciola hepatica TaxID=6192 RepID=A0A4E0QX18_FASHE|nr:Dihydropyrimidinase [Fasciola hepatica]